MCKLFFYANNTMRDILYGIRRLTFTILYHDFIISNL